MTTSPQNIAFGIDIGGSGIKGALVDLDRGEFIGSRYRIPTPQPATPDAVADTVAELVEHFGIDETVPIGIDVPAPIIHGVAPMIANLHESWKDQNVLKLMTDRLGRPVTVLNDADAAGYAEVHYGAANGIDGLVMVLTLGTGIGSVLVMNGVLVPNTELGHLEIDGYDAEKRAATSVFENAGLTYEQWAERLQRYFSHVEMLFSPDVFIIGGGISKKSKKFVPLIDTRAPIIPAELLNTAGIVGSALLAAQEAGTFALNKETKAKIAVAREEVRKVRQAEKEAKKAAKLAAEASGESAGSAE